MAFRHQASFVSDWRPHCRPLDRNTKARIIFVCEALERRTKALGRRNGIVSVIGIIVLRALLFRFHNGKSGLLCPSYDALQKHTGLCRQSIATAIARLELAGVLTITRRLCRQQIERVSPVTGIPETITTTTQATNLYAVSEPGPWADHLARPQGKRAPFPERKQLDILKRMELFWTTRLSLRRREKPLPRVASIVASAAR